MTATLLNRCCPIEYSHWQKYNIPDEVSPLGKTERRWEIIDTRNYLHYRGVPPQQISILSFILVFWTPVYAAGMMVFALARTAARIANVCVEFFSDLFHSKLSLIDMPERGVELLKHAYEGARDIVSAPFYSLALSFSALIGIFIPYEGRKYFALIENHWHSGASYRNDIRRIDGEVHSKSKIFLNCLLDPNSPHVLYLAYCFQALERADVHTAQS
jgi:hypothetical protein